MNEATRLFIRQHINDDIRLLALQGTKNPEVDIACAIRQIDGYRRSVEKLPSWAATEGIVYPSHLSMEQCSSEQTAGYKAEVAGASDGLFVDLTAGFGVDATFIARGFRHAVCVEQQKELCDALSVNLPLLGLHHVDVVNGDGIGYLHTLQHADLLFVDPARRDLHGGRTYGIADCTPNILEVLDEMLLKAGKVMIKLSPMLDWRKAVIDLGRQHVIAVHIVSVGYECKELLIELRGRGVSHEDTAAVSGESPLRVVCVNLLSDGRREVFEFFDSDDSPIGTAIPSTHVSQSSFRFLYEPNASVMKAGCFDLLSSQYGAVQADRNSHLFLSDKQLDSFPGRGFIIERVTTMNKRSLRDSLSDVHQANIAVRNFPMSVVELRRRLKIRDGGDIFIFATTVAGEGYLLFVCRKIS